MRYLLLFVVAAFTVVMSSCRNDFEFERSSGGLGFSRDTVYLDTVFTNIGSSTYTLKVYNRSDKDISIPSIKLGEGENSKYRLMVDGMAGKVFNDVELLAKDSMFIFIETTIDYNEYANDESTFLYTDRIEFDSGSNYQKVELVTLVQDAIFIKPNRSLPNNIRDTLMVSGQQTSIPGYELTTAEELHWTNQKPYVVYGYAFVPNGSTLTVDAGARVHFHYDSGLLVDDSGMLKVNGTTSDTENLEGEVIFEGDRLEPGFADVAGQWNGVYLLSGQDNTINHLTLKNAVAGILVDRVLVNTTPKLTITNSQLYNCRNFGLLAINSNVVAENVAVNNSGEAAIACILGGAYSFKQCTIANYNNTYNQVPLRLNDYYIDSQEGVTYVAAIDAQFDNCIIFGSGTVGLLLEREADQPYSCRFNNSLIKLIDTGNRLRNEPLYPFEGNEPSLAAYSNCIIASGNNTIADFTAPRENILTLGEDSDAIDAAVGIGINTDIVGNARPNPSTGIPDMGAYEYYPEE